jgi:hypothetical protein
MALYGAASNIYQAHSPQLHPTQMNPRFLMAADDEGSNICLTLR